MATINELSIQGRHGDTSSVSMPDTVMARRERLNA